MGLGKFLGKLVGSGVSETANGVANAIDRFVETKEEKKAAELILLKAQQQPDKWQAEINKIEAQHRTIFVAGWRPFVGWVAGFGLAYHFVLFPFLQFIVNVFMKTPPSLPIINIAELITILLAMLGMSATRTYEKRNNLTK